MRGSLPAPDETVQRYRFDGEIARGGMGVVHSALDRLAQRQVAYKRLLVSQKMGKERSDAFFQREYDTLSRLRHPNIIEVYEYGLDEVGPYYTMELLSGQDLAALAPLPFREVCRIARDVASALALVHARGYVHRDVSPANVRLTRDGRAKLFDFGALIEFGPSDHFAGTPAFIAPECLTGSPLDQRTDLFSLGALIYWALTRRLAISRRSLRDVFPIILAAATPASTLDESIPKALDELILSLLQRDPLARPSSAAEVIERLNAIGGLEPSREEQHVAYGYLAHPRLVGRDHVLALLGAELRAALDGTGRSAILTAASGQGRSALLDALVRKARLEGGTVLQVDARHAAGSFGVALALVDQLAVSQPELRPGRKSVFSVLPRMDANGAPLAWSPVDASERKHQLAARVRDLLLEASRKNPIVLVIDDVHAADGESLGWLAAFLAEVPREACFVLLSAELTPDWTESALCTAICAQAEVFELSRLSEAEVEQLVTAVFGHVANTRRLSHWLFEHSGGNPARCVELARALLQHDVIHYTRGVFSLPHDIPDGWEGDRARPIVGRISDLDPTARDLAHLLSIQDLPLSLDALGRATAAPARDVLLALEALIAREFVRAQGQAYAVASRALAGAIRGTLPEAALRALHERSAQALLAEVSEGGPTLRLQAGVHLLAAGRQNEAAELLTPSDGDWMAGETPIHLLEAVLEIERARGRSDEHCLRVLIPLVRSGFFGELATQNRHIDRTLAALARVLGIAFATRWAPRIGRTPALVLGVVGALIRHAFTPKKRRFGSFEETFTALLSILSATVAAVSHAFDAPAARRIVERFEILAAFGADSAPALSLEFCKATADMPAGRFARAKACYVRLLERFKRPVKGMNDSVHLQFRLGVVHGLAQCHVTDTLPAALELADELERSHRFFAPHAETIRMGYHAYRGERELAEQCRRRGETLALQGGISWSAVAIMILRAMYVAQHTHDVVEITRLLPEFERMAKIAPNFLYYRECALAFLELLRAQPQRAVEVYERAFALADAQHMLTYPIDRAHYARALCEAKRLDEAERVCLQTSAELPADEVRYLLKLPRQQHALVQLARGDVVAAKQQLEQLLAELQPFDNPLWLGEVQRDLARVALASHDAALLRRALDEMSIYFRHTENAALIQQSEQVVHEAERALPDAYQLRVVANHELDSTEIEPLIQLPLTEAEPAGAAAEPAISVVRPRGQTGSERPGSVSRRGAAS
jgi:Protein kinase domain/AAA ATPase domain